jgi:Asp-tRNA(Asn)/Glu-tRNA(Gln) amidotransferase C subunit
MKKRISFDQLREDVSKKSLTQEEVLKNAKHTEEGFVKVYGELFGSIEES